MGFRLTFAYDAGLVEPVSAVKGQITKDGLMEDSIGTGDKGAFDVLWSSDEQTDKDGTVAVLTFKVLKPEDTSVGISYSQVDTFDGDFKDVELDCKDIPVVFGQKADNVKSQISRPPEAGSDTAGTGRAAESGDIISAVETVLSEKGRVSLSEIPENEQNEFTDRVNYVLSGITGNNESRFENIAKIGEAYTDANIDRFAETYYPFFRQEEIRRIEADALKTAGAQSFSGLRDDEKETVSSFLIDEVSEKVPDSVKYGEKLDAESIIKAFEKLKEKSDESEKDSITVPDLTPANSKNDRRGIKPIVILAASAAAIVLSVIIIKHILKRRKKENETV